MKRKAKEITKVSMLYDRKMLIVCIILFIVLLLMFLPARRNLDNKEGNVIIKFLAQLYSFEWLKYFSGKHAGRSALAAILSATVFWPLLLFSILFYFEEDVWIKTVCRLRILA